ncbi:glycoprotein-N-acetylgalactosamine 3-beta-galactosyltransferase 1-like [Amphiura filiformis]|uniref:glycoprotein-N-acetylgalactosamine 3-beta-galactosyltransferase 1-like n=1 Tax=Amphiura filiformis TaxID=82378 RepID=UPI003B214700
MVKHHNYERKINNGSVEEPDKLLKSSWLYSKTSEKQLASLLEDKVHILCWIMTSPTNLYTRAAYLKVTWTRRCNIVVFISSEEDEDFPAVGVGGKEGGDFLWVKTRRSLQYLYRNYINQADWFLKADDDAYVIMENLRYFLADKDPSEPVYYGRRFKSAMNTDGYMSGGAGYIMSKVALEQLVMRSFSNQFVCPSEQFVDLYPGLAEDSALGVCMQAAGVTAGDTRDALGRERFHPLEAWELLDPFYLVAPEYWLWKYSFYPSLKAA